jgi:Putative MetA-pathway of phenol degradation
MKALAGGLATVVCVLSLTTPASAADPITTDRPDVVESSLTVGRGRFQIETSIARERDKDAGARTTVFTTPTLLRLGVSENVELRFETEGYVRAKLSDPAAGIEERESGYADASLGVKWHVLDGKGLRPSAAMLLHADIDSGSRPFRGEGVRPSLRMPFEWELANDFSLGIMPGIVYDKTNGARHASGILAAVLGKEWTPRFRSFVEVAAERIASSRHGGSIVTYNTGVAYLLTDNVQIDTAVSWAANHNTPDFAWTVGLSIRF